MMLHHSSRPAVPNPRRSSAETTAGTVRRHAAWVRPTPWWVVRSWPLWSLPRPALLYVLVVDAVALVAVAVSVPSSVTWADVQITALISGAMLAHLYLTREDERIHRTRDRSPHTDLGWVWLFPGAVLLPPSLATFLVLLYAQRSWLYNRLDCHPPYRRLFSAAVWILATGAAAAVISVSGRREHLVDRPGGWLDLAILLLAAGAAVVVNTVLVAGMLALAAGARRLGLFAGRTDNLLEFSTLLLGMCVALAVAWWPPFVALIVLPAVLLHRTLRIQHLEVVARTDDKTGVLNARAFQHQVRVELARTRRHAGSMALFMVDMDGFKQINDEHGHLAGDAVLRRVARVIAAEVRRTDAVGRLGGDEFAVLLPAIDVSEALAVAERIRAQIRQLPAPISRRLSTSIGVAVYPHVAADTVENLLAAADMALYEAKRSGRNRTCVAGRRAASFLPAADHYRANLRRG